MSLVEEDRDELNDTMKIANPEINSDKSPQNQNRSRIVELLQVPLSVDFK
jgi:hypothetical protein